MDYQNVLAKYGVCQLDANKLLWTFQDAEFALRDDRHVFAGIDPRLITAHMCPQNEVRNMFTLSTLRPLTLVAPCDIVPHNLRCVSYMAELYSDIMGQEWRWTSPVQFKQDVHARAPLLHALHRMGIDGWLQPVEVLPYVMEVCLGPFATQKVRIVAPDASLDCKVAAAPGACAAWLNGLTLQSRRGLQRSLRAHRRTMRYAWTPFDQLYMD